MPKATPKFSFSELARELKSEQEAKDAEVLANRFLATRGYARDGRRATEPRESVRVTYNHNG